MYSQARFHNIIRSNNPLTNDQLKVFAPSIFAEAPHQSRSERYVYIPTYKIVDGLRHNGFSPVMATQSRTLDINNREFTKHLVRFRHESDMTTQKEVGQEIKEIVLVNSHNGASSYQIYGGLYRLVCSNGLVVGDDFAEYRVRHSGNLETIKGQVIEGAYTILDNFNLIDENMDTMKSISLNPEHQRAFAKSALMLRYDDIEDSPITEEKLLNVRRREDNDNSLWTVFNKVQENLLQGGLHGRNKKRKLVTTRPIKNIDKDIKLNRALWTLSQEMAKLAA